MSGLGADNFSSCLGGTPHIQGLGVGVRVPGRGLSMDILGGLIGLIRRHWHVSLMVSRLSVAFILHVPEDIQSENDWLSYVDQRDIALRRSSFRDVDG